MMMTFVAEAERMPRCRARRSRLMSLVLDGMENSVGADVFP
jgi:hypothetical protein